MRSREQSLAVLVLIAAAVASAASDGGSPGEFGSWDLSKQVEGPLLVLGDPQTRRVALEINEAALSDGEEPMGTLVATAYACVTSTAGNPVRLRGSLLPESGTGPVTERAVPPCPDVEPVALSVWHAFTCTNGGACLQTWDVRFERVGSTGTDLQVSWEVSAYLTFYGDDDVPPEGADFNLEVEP